MRLNPSRSPPFDVAQTALRRRERRDAFRAAAGASSCLSSPTAEGRTDAGRSN